MQGLVRLAVTMRFYARVSPSGVVPFDYVRKRFSAFNRFRRFNGGGAALKNMEAPRRFETSGFLVSQTQSLATNP